MISLVNGASQTEFGNEFMKLLMIQLQNQDPMDQVNDKEFLAQMAQFSSLAELTKLNTSFSQALQIQQVSEARDMIGQNITFKDPDSGDSLSGLVNGVRFGEDGLIMLQVNGREVPLSSLEGING